MFVDIAEITVKSGRGGDGAVTFRREPYVPQGGPDGGNGGNGGDIVFEADRNLRTLMDFNYKRKYVAEDGVKGMGSNKYGKGGKDLTIKVPVGTVVSDRETGLLMRDLREDGERYVAAIGGKGGLGNSHFKNSKRQAPNFAEAGTEGTERVVRLELKLIADVGLAGFPNVGKSTLLSVASAAKPKIANYHFTTIYPNLGVVNVGDTEFVLADIPGLIEGASQGAGLGHDFLKHIERTKMIIHVIDASGSEGRTPQEDYERIEKELAEYSGKLIKKPRLAALNKMDITDTESEDYIALTERLREDGVPYFPISAVTTAGVGELMNAVGAELARIEREQADVGESEDYDHYGTFDVVPENATPDYRDIHVEIEDGVFVLTGKQLKKIFESTNFSDYDSLRYLWKYLVKNGTVKRMKAAGIEEGDTVNIYGMEFDYEDE